MAQNETWLKHDMMNAVKVNYLDGNVFSQDNAGNLIGVILTKGGIAYSGGGSISGNVIRSDGATVAVSGTLVGNNATVVLPQSAYAVPGIISIIIKLTDNGEITTIGAVVANVYQSSTDTAVDPGTIIPSISALIAEIDAAIASIPSDYSDLLTALKDQNTVTFHGGYVKYSDGGITEGGGVYSYTDKIAVQPGDVFSVVAVGSASVLTVAAYENSTSTAANISKSIRGTGSLETFEYTVPDGIYYIRLTTSQINNSIIRKNSYTRGLKLQNIVLLHDGYVKKSDGTIQNGSGSYSYSDMIAVKQGERIVYDLTASGSVLMIAAYINSTDTAAILSLSVFDNSGSKKGVYIVPLGVNYIRISNYNGYNGKVYRDNVASVGDLTGFILEERNLAFGKPILFNQYINGSTTGGGNSFFTVTDIPVAEGVTYYIFCDGSYAQNASYKDARYITAYDSNGSVISSEAYVSRKYTAPTGAVRVSITYFYYVDATGSSEIGITGNYYFSQYPLTNRIGFYTGKPVMNYKTISDSEIFYEEPRKATINFTFDDGLSQDSQLVTIFDNHGARCGFALIGWVMQSYNLPWYYNLYQRGYSILCHSNNGEAMGTETNYTEAQLLVKMRDPLVELETVGMKISGWVTPSSYLKPAYLPTLGKFYNYGFTRYLGTWDGTGTPYDTISNSGLELKRVHVATTTIENLKSAVDTAIEHDGLLSFYGHGYELDEGGGLDPAKLEELIEYIKSKERQKLCHLYAPDEAMLYYFRPRHND